MNQLSRGNSAVESSPHKRVVAGSNPAPATILYLKGQSVGKTEAALDLVGYLYSQPSVIKIEPGIYYRF